MIGIKKIVGLNNKISLILRAKMSFFLIYIIYIKD